MKFEVERGTPRWCANGIPLRCSLDHPNVPGQIRTRSCQNTFSKHSEPGTPRYGSWTGIGVKPWRS